MGLYEQFFGESGSGDLHKRLVELLQTSSLTGIRKMKIVIILSSLVTVVHMCEVKTWHSNNSGRSYVDYPYSQLTGDTVMQWRAGKGHCFEAELRVDDMSYFKIVGPAESEHKFKSYVC